MYGKVFIALCSSKAEIVGFLNFFFFVFSVLRLCGQVTFNLDELIFSCIKRIVKYQELRTLLSFDIYI